MNSTTSALAPLARRRVKLRLKVSLPVFFCLFISLASLIIVWLSHATASKAIEGIAQSLVLRVSEHTLEKTVNLLDDAASMVRLNAVLLKPEGKGGLAVEKFDRVSRKEMALFPHAALVYYGDEKGNHWASKRSADGTVNTRTVVRRIDTETAAAALAAAQSVAADTAEGMARRRRLLAPILTTTWHYHDSQGAHIRSEPDPYSAFDPRQRPWYQGAREAGDVFWTEVYVWTNTPLHGGERQVGVTVAAPVREGGRLLGVTGIDIVLDDISNFLRGLVIGKQGRAFIIDAEGRTVGLPDYGDMIANGAEASGEVKLNHISRVSNPAMRQAYQTLRETLRLGEGESVKLDQEVLVPFAANGVAHYGFFKSFALNGQRPWIIGVVAPEDDFLGETRRNLWLGLLLSLASVAVVVWLSMRISREITQPLSVLAGEAERIRYLDLQPSEPVRSIFQEIDQVAASFANMKTSLRSFEKYVPTDLVRHLIGSGQEAQLGGERRSLSIFFSDLVGFTGICESLPPEELVLLLGEYLGEMSNVIARHRGTVDKYIGDALMAFWNAPCEDGEHAVHACLAALESQEVLVGLRRRWQEQGLRPLYSRIGINTGDVVVGNFGADSRLNYTCAGDPVNLASRLEGLCNLYGVEIIISATTFDQARDHIEARRLDCVAVKGKAEGGIIYELIGRRGSLTAAEQAFVAAYERAFSTYLDQRWEDAAVLFEEALRLKDGNDTASAKMAARCRDYAAGTVPASVIHTVRQK